MTHTTTKSKPTTARRLALGLAVTAAVAIAAPASGLAAPASGPAVAYHPALLGSVGR